MCVVFKRKTAYDVRISDWSSDVCSSDLRNPARPLRPRHPPRPAHRPDQRARSGERLSPHRLERRRLGGKARKRSRKRREGGQGVDGGPCPFAARFPGGRRPADRLWQQHPSDGEGRRRGQRLRFPRLRSRLYPPALLPRYRAVPLGGAVGRSRGSLSPRRSEENTAARRYASSSRSEEHTSELQSLMRISYAVFCFKKKNKTDNNK